MSYNYACMYLLLPRICGLRVIKLELKLNLIEILNSQIFFFLILAFIYRIILMVLYMV